MERFIVTLTVGEIVWYYDPWGYFRNFWGGDLLLGPWKPYPTPDLVQLKFPIPYYAKRKI